MIRLTRVEMRRLFSRRLTAIALLGALVVTGLLLFDASQQAKPLSATEVAANRVQFDLAQKDWGANGAAQIADCTKSQTEAQKTDPKVDFGCSHMGPPSLANWGKPKAKFSELMPSTLLSGSYVLAAVAFLIGACFVSAEFSSGAIGNWLTFEPRRMRVYGSKLAAAGLGLLPVVVALIALLTAGVWLIVGHFASTGGTTATIWADLGEMGGRSVALALAAAFAGAASGMLLRYTAAVVGIAVAYLVLVEGIFRNAIKGAQPWLVGTNVLAWLEHGTKYSVDSCKTNAQGSYSCERVEKLLTFGHSSAYLGVMVVVVIALAALVFRRRDLS